MATDSALSEYLLFTVLFACFWWVYGLENAVVTLLAPPDLTRAAHVFWFEDCDGVTAAFTVLDWYLSIRIF